MEITYVLDKDDPFVVLDLDAVVTDDGLSPSASEIVRTVDSYTEHSRSGTGLHIVAEGERIWDQRCKHPLPDYGHIEVYDASQCIIMTGDILEDRDRITAGGTAEVQKEHRPEPSESHDFDKEVSSISAEDRPESTEHLTPADIRRTLEEYAATGHETAQRALHHWDASDPSLISEDQRARGDMTFVSDLAFWTREDPKLMDDCFRASDRMFARWDQPIYRSSTASGSEVTYAEDSIDKAIRTNIDVFSGNYVVHR